MPVFPQDIPATDVQKSIATHIVEELEDGCTLQLGMGDWLITLARFWQNPISKILGSIAK